MVLTVLSSEYESLSSQLCAYIIFMCLFIVYWSIGMALQIKMVLKLMSELRILNITMKPMAIVSDVTVIVDRSYMASLIM